MYQRNTIRGAISVSEDSRDAILSATAELFSTIVDRNQLQQEEVEAILFSATPDLTAVYPAIAIREMGWDDIPMMCFQEMAVVDALPACIRMIVFNTKKEIKPRHVYLHEAEKLRPDLIHEVQNASN
ncbi:MAG: chorismate mutase [Anaerolineaceae bacterium]|nr:chorismate mutase [Anaerolineaceae bacterium]